MKQIKSRLTKFKRGAANTEKSRPSRITNETVAEHREKILAGGRKFKYPMQYSRHKLVINTVIISLSILVILAIVLWWQLYPAQNTSKFIYRVTQLLPVPVASVDGAWVGYSDYLKKFRSSLHFLQSQNDLNVTTQDGKRQIDFIKRQELNSVIKDAYVAKLAKQNNLSVNAKEVDDFVARELASKKVSEQAYEKTVLARYYDWSIGEYKDVVKAELLKRKVSFKIDSNAKKRAESIMARLSTGADFAALAKTESDDVATKANGGDSGNVSSNTFDPNGVIAALSTLQPGQMTKLIEGVDGYYIAKLTTKSESSIQYMVIKISLSELDSQFDAVKKANKIKEYIDVKQY